MLNLAHDVEVPGNTTRQAAIRAKYSKYGLCGDEVKSTPGRRTRFLLLFVAQKLDRLHVMLLLMMMMMMMILPGSSWRLATSNRSSTSAYRIGSSVRGS